MKNQESMDRALKRDAELQLARWKHNEHLRIVVEQKDKARYDRNEVQEQNRQKLNSMRSSDYRNKVDQHWEQFNNFLENKSKSISESIDFKEKFMNEYSYPKKFSLKPFTIHRCPSKSWKSEFLDRHP